MSKHTPGPWQTQLSFLNVFTFSEGKTGLTIHLAKCNEEQVAGGRAEAEANARLIAAAPELLEALEVLVNHVALNGVGQPRYSSAAPAFVALDAARAAIARAKGEAT